MPTHSYIFNEDSSLVGCDSVTGKAVWDVLNDSSAFNTVSHIR